MYGPDILARFLEVPGKPDNYGNRWQYHPRSDRHSRVGCWGVALDLLTQSSLLRSHVEQGKLVLGVNHAMRDYATSRQKKLDLVVARPASRVSSSGKTFAGLVDEFGIVLTEEEQAALEGIARLPVAPVGAVLIALEAKACMTEHVKSLPRLYDELNSSHLCVHGASQQALAVGYVQVNLTSKYVSPTRNPFSLSSQEPVVSHHNQPGVTKRVLRKVGEMPRRSASSEVGFDGIGVTMLDFRNDGGPVRLVDEPPAPQPGDTFCYDDMIMRMATRYDATFGHI
jgi:hypothetical protein